MKLEPMTPEQFEQAALAMIDCKEPFTKPLGEAWLQADAGQRERLEAACAGEFREFRTLGHYLALYREVSQT